MEPSSAQVNTAAVAPAARELFCPECGYNLRGITSERCPECGMEIDRAKLAESQIPWAHRAKIGRVRAYVRTAWMATVRPDKLAMEMAGPVSYADARKFWLLTVAVVWVSVGTVVAWGHLMITWKELLLTAGMGLAGSAVAWGTPAVGLPAWVADVGLPAAVGVSMLPVALGAILVFLVLATGVVSWFFHPKSMPVVRQNRAVALSCYACGILAWIPVAVAAGCAAWLMDDLRLNTTLTGGILTGGAIGVAVGLPGAQIIFFYGNTLRLVSVTTRDGARVWLAAFVLPVMWVVIALLTLVGIPWVAGFFWLVVASLGSVFQVPVPQ